jgi:CRP-like cAMP-binding protein/membrane protease YdiL (CAAX protease family)
MTINIRDALTNSSLVMGLSSSEIDQLIQLGVTETYSARQRIIKENDVSDKLYMLLEGDVEIVKKATGSDDEYHIGEIVAPNVFGEIAFADDKPRSSSVIAKNPVKVWAVSKKDILNHMLNAEAVVTKMINNVHEVISKRFRTTNIKYTASLEEQVRQLKERTEFGQLFILCIFLLGVGSIVSQLLTNQFQWIDRLSILFGWIYLLAISIPVVAFVIIHKFNLNEFGVTLQNWRSSIYESIIITLILATVLVGIFVIKQKFQQQSFFAGIELRYFSVGGFLLYVLHASLQEFIARGILLNSLRRFLSNYNNFTIIVVSALLFGLMHLFIGTVAVLVTFFAGILFAYIYIRHNTLVGVCVVHILIGWLALVLGFLS